MVPELKALCSSAPDTCHMAIRSQFVSFINKTGVYNDIYFYIYRPHIKLLTSVSYIKLAGNFTQLSSSLEDTFCVPRGNLFGWPHWWWEDFHRNPAGSANCSVQTSPEKGASAGRQAERRLVTFSPLRGSRMLIYGGVNREGRSLKRSRFSRWETSSYELHKDKLLMWKLMTSIFVDESQKCLGGAPPWV